MKKRIYTEEHKRKIGEGVRKALKGRSYEDIYGSRAEEQKVKRAEAHKGKGKGKRNIKARKNISIGCRKYWLTHKKKIQVEARECEYDQCTVLFNVDIRSKQRFCSRKCASIHIGEIKRGATKKIPEEMRVCGCGCGKDFVCKVNNPKRYLMGHNFRGKPAWNKGLTKNSEDIRIIGNASHKIDCKCSICKAQRHELNGDVHPCWLGGIGNLPYPFEFNNKLKVVIKERDDYICQLCGKTEAEEKEALGCGLAVHHIDYIKENLDPDNLITLCCSCNFKVNANREKWTKYFQNLLLLRKAG